MRQTSNLNLNLLDGNDRVSPKAINENMEKIGKELDYLAQGAQIRVVNDTAEVKQYAACDYKTGEQLSILGNMNVIFGSYVGDGRYRDGDYFEDSVATIIEFPVTPKAWGVYAYTAETNYEPRKQTVQFTNCPVLPWGVDSYQTIMEGEGVYAAVILYDDNRVRIFNDCHDVDVGMKAAAQLNREGRTYYYWAIY